MLGGVRGHSRVGFYTTTQQEEAILPCGVKGGHIGDSNKILHTLWDRKEVVQAWWRARRLTQANNNEEAPSWASVGNGRVRLLLPPGCIEACQSRPGKAESLNTIHSLSYGLYLEYPQTHVLKASSPGQQSSKVGLRRSDWIMQAPRKWSQQTMN